VFDDGSPGSAGVPPPRWRGRLDGLPDVYLLLPGSDDMGIKWREGLLQIKGRVASVGQERFGARHAGRVERWLKWSYAGLPSPYRDLFAADESGRQTIAVQKRRMLRLFEVHADGTTGERDPDLRVARGINAEIADVEARGKRFTTLGFEAFPEDAVIARHFVTLVSRFLDSLVAARLDAESSQSYPQWLARFSD
jgi:hypothetical protein